MRYLSENEMTQMMGIGYFGEVRQGPDGNLYQWVQGVDGLGNPVGFWKALRRIGRRFRRFARRALPIVQQFAPFVPSIGPAVPVVTSAIPAATTPVTMPATPAETPATVATETSVPAETATAGWGLGEIGIGPDGNLYQWVQGVDGLGNPFRFWRRLKRLARRVVSRALPIVQQAAPFIPGGAAALTAATPILKEAGVTGYGGLGALYQAPDGSLYQVQGLAEDEELRGLAEDEELRGLNEDEELRGFGQEEELRGLEDDEELRGLDEDEELRGLTEEQDLSGFAQDDELRGLSQGYVREPGTSGLEAYLSPKPPETHTFTPPAQPPEMWKPLW